MPIPRCYDVRKFGDDKDFIIIMEDLSEDYLSAEKVDYNNESVWFACAESLALFHATFMNSDMIGKDMFRYI